MGFIDTLVRQELSRRGGPMADRSARPEVTVHLFCGPYGTVNGCRAEIPEGSRRLLALAALNPGPLDRRHAAGILWPVGDDAERRETCDRPSGDSTAPSSMSSAPTSSRSACARTSSSTLTWPRRGRIGSSPGPVTAPTSHSSRGASPLARCLPRDPSARAGDQPRPGPGEAHREPPPAARRTARRHAALPGSDRMRAAEPKGSRRVGGRWVERCRPSAGGGNMSQGSAAVIPSFRSCSSSTTPNCRLDAGGFQ